MVRRTKDEAELTRKAILKAAEMCFYNNGVVSTSLNEIAKIAGVTRGAVYWHFKDKIDLLRHLADEAFLPHEDLLDRLVAQDHEDPLSALCSHCCASLDALANDPHRRRLLTILTQRCEYIEEMEMLTQRNDACRERVRARLTSVLDQAQKKKRLAAHWTPSVAALALQSMMIGFIYHEMEWVRPSRARDKARNEAIVSFFRALEI